MKACLLPNAYAYVMYTYVDRKKNNEYFMNDQKCIWLSQCTLQNPESL